MSFLSFNYWHPVVGKWCPTIENADRISRAEPDPKNAPLTRIWLGDESYPGLLTDMTWAQAATALGVQPPGAAPTEPPVLA